MMRTAAVDDEHLETLWAVAYARDGVLVYWRDGGGQQTGPALTPFLAEASLIRNEDLAKELARSLDDRTERIWAAIRVERKTSLKATIRVADT